MPQVFGKYLQNRVYEEEQSLHNILLNTNLQPLALATDSTSHLDTCSLQSHNNLWNLGNGGDLWKADGLKWQHSGDVTALPASAASMHSFSTLSWALWKERSLSPKLTAASFTQQYQAEVSHLMAGTCWDASHLFIETVIITA